MRILEEHGLEFLGDQALEILKRGGADVDRDTRMVRFDRGLIDEYVRLAPSSFTLHARNPERNLGFGGNSIAFAQVSSAPNCSDLDGGRRPGNWRDFRNLVRLTQSLNILHCFGGYPVEPIDLPAPSRHFFRAAHTLARYRTAFYTPILSDWRNFEQWREAGATRRSAPRPP